MSWQYPLGTTKNLNCLDEIIACCTTECTFFTKPNNFGEMGQIVQKTMSDFEVPINTVVISRALVFQTLLENCLKKDFYHCDFNIMLVHKRHTHYNFSRSKENGKK